MNWMIQVKFAGSIHSGTRKREGDGEREGYLPREKGLENPFGLCVGRGSIPRRALSLVFKVGEERRWFRGTRSTTRTGENSGAGRFHSALRCRLAKLTNSIECGARLDPRRGR